MAKKLLKLKSRLTDLLNGFFAFGNFGLHYLSKVSSISITKQVKANLWIY